MADKTSDSRQSWTGATQQLKAQFRRQVDDATYRQIAQAAHDILGALPKKYPLGTLTAALMLAATAYAESAPHASKLIEHAE